MFHCTSSVPLQLLAVVFDTFNDVEKMKFKSLLLHKRSAIDHAFQLLVSRQVQLWRLWVSSLDDLFCDAASSIFYGCDFCCALLRGRWACRWNNSTALCVFTDHVCRHETASSLIKLWTPQGLQCSGNWAQATLHVDVHRPHCFHASSALAYRTFINSMRSLGLNGR